MEKLKSRTSFALFAFFFASFAVKSF